MFFHFFLQNYYYSVYKITFFFFLNWNIHSWWPYRNYTLCKQFFRKCEGLGKKRMPNLLIEATVYAIDFDGNGHLNGSWFRNVDKSINSEEKQSKIQILVEKKLKDQIYHTLIINKITDFSLYFCIHIWPIICSAFFHNFLFLFSKQTVYIEPNQYLSIIISLFYSKIVCIFL